MSNQRYIRLQEIQYDSFVLDAPAEIEKGALLLDTKTKSVLLQLRLNILNLKLSEISSITLKIRGLTDSGENVKKEGYSYYTFMDINLLDQKTFGEKTPIVLDYKVRKVEVEIDKIVLSNGNIWRPPKQKFTSPIQQLIESLPDDLYEQFNREINKLDFTKTKNFKFLPLKQDDFWFCTCGRSNRNQDNNCVRCGLEKRTIFEVTDNDFLRENLKNFRETSEVQKRKKRKIIRFVSISLIGIAFAGVLIINYLFPFIKYRQALNLFDKLKYDQAIAIFESLDDYKDSEKLTKEALYEKGEDFLRRKQYDEAIAIFESLDDYKDSEKLTKEALYEKGEDFLRRKQYDEAIAIFDTLVDLKDSKELSNDAKLQKGKALLEDKQFDDALSIFNSLVDYQDTDELINETKYQKAITMIEDEIDCNEAINILENLEGYKNSTSIMEYYKELDWSFDGEMSKQIYEPGEAIIIEYGLLGESSCMTIDLKILCYGDNWAIQPFIHKDVSIGANYKKIFSSLSFLTGQGVCEISNNTTGEILATYPFEIIN